MKQFLILLLITSVISFLFAQGLTKNGKITNTASTYVNKNGAIGISGLTKNGAPFSSINNGVTNALDFDGTNDNVSISTSGLFQWRFYN